MASHSESNNARVERHFKKNPNRTLLLGQIAHATGLSRDQVRGAISYINAKAKAGNAIGITVVKRGKQYRYDAPVEKPKVDKRAEMPNRVDGQEVPVNTSPEDIRAARTNRLRTKDFNRMVDALGHEDVPAAEPVLAKEIRLRLVGITPDGYAIGVDDGTGNTFKVVPV